MLQESVLLPSNREWEEGIMVTDKENHKHFIVPDFWGAITMYHLETLSNVEQGPLPCYRKQERELGSSSKRKRTLHYRIKFADLTTFGHSSIVNRTKHLLTRKSGTF